MPRSCARECGCAPQCRSGRRQASTSSSVPHRRPCCAPHRDFNSPRLSLPSPPQPMVHLTINPYGFHHGTIVKSRSVLRGRRSISFVHNSVKLCYTLTPHHEHYATSSSEGTDTLNNTSPVITPKPVLRFQPHVYRVIMHLL